MFKKIQRFLKRALELKCARASLYYVTANIVGQGIVLVSSAFFTRLMDKNSYGLVSTYSTWVLVVNCFICLNVYITVRNAFIDYKEDYERYCSSVLLLNVLIGVLMSSLLFAFCKIIGMAVSSAEILLVCIQSVSLNVMNYILAIQSMENQYKSRTLMMILPNWTHIILSVILILIFTQNQYMAKIFGNAAGLLIFAVFCSIAVFAKNRPVINMEYWRYALTISLPSIFCTLSELILMQSDRLMLTELVGAEKTAEYSVIYNIGSIIIAIYQATNGAWLPMFYNLLKRKQSETVRRYEKYYLILFTLFTCGMMTISPELIKIISPSNYWEGISYVSAIVVASYIIYLNAFYSGYLIFEKKTGDIARNSVIVAVINVVLNYLLIPRCQSVGAVIATIISYLLLHVLHCVSVSNMGKKYLAVGDMWKQLGTVAIYGVLFTIVKDLWVLRYLLYIVFAICIAYRNNNQIVLLLRKIEGKEEG